MGEAVSCEKMFTCGKTPRGAAAWYKAAVCTRCLSKYSGESASAEMPLCFARTVCLTFSTDPQNAVDYFATRLEAHVRKGGSKIADLGLNYKKIVFGNSHLYATYITNKTQRGVML